MEQRDQNTSPEAKNSSEFQHSPLPESEGRRYISYYNERLPELLDGAPNVERYIEGRLTGRRLIDLGTGGLANMVAQFAVRMHVPELICVEKYHRPQLIQDPDGLTQYIHGWEYDPLTKRVEPRKKHFVTSTEAEIVALATGLKELQYSAIRLDMLDFLKDQPDGSANILMGGIDQYILGSGEYRSALFHQISRVIGSDGVLLDRLSVQPDDESTLRVAGLQADPEYPKYVEQDGSRQDWPLRPFTNVYVVGDETQ